jgi:thiol-disulfide isomerase/thioredoxin
MQALSLVLTSTLLLGAAAAQEPAPAPKPVPADASTAKPAAAMKLTLGSRLDGLTTLKDLDGNDHKAKSYMGKIVVVNFFSIQCPIQKAWDPTLTEIQTKYADKVVFLNIDSNVTEIGAEPAKAGGDAKPYANIREHLKERKLPYTVLVDHGNVVADIFEARATPHVFVFGANGKLVYRGAIDDDQKREKGDGAKRYLVETLDKLIAGETVEPYETNAVGCTIKRVKADKPKAEAGDAKKEAAK